MIHQAEDKKECSVCGSQSRQFCFYAEKSDTQNSYRKKKPGKCIPDQRCQVPCECQNHTGYSCCSEEKYDRGTVPEERDSCRFRILKEQFHKRSSENGKHSPGRNRYNGCQTQSLIVPGAKRTVFPFLICGSKNADTSCTDSTGENKGKQDHCAVFHQICPGQRKHLFCRSFPGLKGITEQGKSGRFPEKKEG